MFENNKSMHNICARLGRTESAIRSRLMKMGLIANPYSEANRYSNGRTDS